MSTGQSRAVMEGDLQIVSVNNPPSTAMTAALPPKPSGSSKALVEYKLPLFREEEEDLGVKLQRINENVPLKVSNTSGSSAGSGSGDFHQYRQMRRREQDRLARMEADYQSRKELAEYEIRRKQRLEAAEERTAKKRAKRQKQKQKRKEKRCKSNSGGEEEQKEDYSDSEHTDGDQAGGV